MHRKGLKRSNTFGVIIISIVFKMALNLFSNHSADHNDPIHRQKLED